MKRNKFIYMIVFLLVFLGFTGGVNAEFCCNANTGESNGKPEGACTASTEKWTDEAGCAAAYDYNTHQCCNNLGGVKEASDATDCSRNYGSQGYSWKTVYSCSESKMVCCHNGTITGKGKDECVSKYEGSELITLNWVSRATCENLSQTSTRDTINHNDMINPNITPFTPPSNDPSDPDNSKAGNDGVSGKSGTTGDETITIGFNCEDPSIASIVKTAKTVYNLLRYSVPVILIIMGSIDFLKATIAGKDDEIEKHKKTFINRLFLAVIIFMLLSIFQLTTNLLEHAGVSNSNTWYECWNHINDE